MTVSLYSPAQAAYSIVPADVLTPFDPRLTNAGAVLGAANRGVYCRVVALKSGFLRDVTVLCTVQSGNIDLGIYDTGDTTPNVRTLLGHSGSIACPAVATLNPPATWDPGAGVIPIVAGRQYDFGLSADNNTAAFQRIATGTFTQMPTGAWAVPGGCTPKLTYIVPSTFPLGATIAEGATASVASVFFIMGRISPT